MPVVIEQGRQLEALKNLVQRQATTLENIELERIKSTNSFLKLRVRHPFVTFCH